MKIGNIEFDLENEAYIMGILNVTPDSFSDGGNYQLLSNALKRAEQMIEEGAAILDLGGESTRPGYVRVTIEEEIERVVPVIEHIKKNFAVPISIDTYKSEVAEAALKAGADMINDIWGFQGEGDMAGVAAKYNVPCCIMHNRDVEKQPYHNFLEDCINDLQESIRIGIQAGVKREHLIIDPGIGFAKTQEENLYIMKHIAELKQLGCPVLLGTSRKRMIGNVLGLEVKERMEGTVATTVYGLLHGCSIFRVHDVKENYRALKMTLAIRE